jgi:GTP-binding protein EngB required for normal cell division
MDENYLFVGNPGTGKSTLLNCLIGQRVFESGLSYGEGLTQCFQRFAHNGTVFMDTPGLADCMKEQAAAAITKALRQGGAFKLFFMVRLESGRVVSDDLATIETVMDSIEMKDVPFSVVVNNVKKRQYTAMMKKGAELFKVVALINSGKYATPFLTFIPTLPSLDEMGNAIAQLPHEVDAFFRCDAPAVAIPPHCVKAIRLVNYKTLVDDLRDQLEHVRRDNAAMRQKLEELVQKPKFLQVLMSVVGVALSALVEFAGSNVLSLESLLNGDVTGVLDAARNLLTQ